MRVPGAPFSGYGHPAKYEDKVTRTAIGSQPGTTGSGASRTPLERLQGMITPSGLHFERHHSGVPDIDPSAHRLLIHGLVTLLHLNGIIAEHEVVNARTLPQVKMPNRDNFILAYPPSSK